MTLSLLFGFFSNLMLAYYAPEKSEQGIAAFLGLKSPWQSRGIAKCHEDVQWNKNHADHRRQTIYRCQSKGVGNPSLNDSDLLRELVFKILH